MRKHKEVENTVIPGSVLDRLLRIHPDEMEKWDRWNYVVYGPVGFDDPYQVTVYLKYEDGHKVALVV